MHIDNEDEGFIASSNGESAGEVMKVVVSVTSKAVHPITIMTSPRRMENERIPCGALLDQCCTDEGLINYNPANSFVLLGEKSWPKSFITAAGIHNKSSDIYE